VNNQKALVLSYLCVLVCVVLPLQPCFSTANYTRNYYLEAGRSKYKLNLKISESLYNQYQAKSHTHTLNFNKFVTPQALVQVANQIRVLFTGDEDFANAVLMVVHQIPYEVGNLKYPVETIVLNSGDCDNLSVLAASLMKAGGLDVVLLLYSDHMNLGVHLPQVPRDSRDGYSCVNHDGKRFYVAETTSGSDWESSWRVGESPSEYGEASVISLENCESSSPEQVTATLTKIGSDVPLIRYEQVLLIACLGVVCSCILYGFLRLRRASDEKLPSGVWCVCPKCGAYISVDIEYCVCGAKLPKKKKKK